MLAIGATSADALWEDLGQPVSVDAGPMRRCLRRCLRRVAMIEYFIGVFDHGL